MFTFVPVQEAGVVAKEAALEEVAATKEDPNVYPPYSFRY